MTSVLSGYAADKCRIIAVDGEGTDIAEPFPGGIDHPALSKLGELAEHYGMSPEEWTKFGSHAYLLLAAADDRGEVAEKVWAKEENRRPIEDDRMPNYGLSTEECFEFLLDLRKHDSDIFVAFSFSYDIFQMVRDMPVSNLEELFGSEDGVTQWGDYRVKLLPRKFIEIVKTRGRGCFKRKLANGRWGYSRSVKVFDAFGYFQMSFVSALHSSEHLFTGAHDREMIEMIARMKKERSGPDLFKDRDAVLEYCLTECRFLAMMMRDINVNTEKQGIRVNSWHGASAIAAQWLKDNGIHRAVSDSDIPLTTVMAGYYGGRFEQSRIGYIGDGYSYDINSAYPAEMVSLPCLRPGHTRARQVIEVEPGKIGIYLAGSETSGEWAPFPIRVDRDAAQAGTRRRHMLAGRMTEHTAAMANRAVLFAHGGRRWVWSPEVETARKWHGDAAIPVYDGWVIDQLCDCPPPLREIADLYAERQAIKKSEPGRQKVIKLMINSLYGKLAQSVGWRPDQDDGSRPPYLCYIWAGLITSGTRAKIYDILMTSGTCVSIATDGIICTEPIPGIENSKALGEWEFGEYRNVYLYTNGVYSYDEKTDAGWETDHVKSRGFSPADITVDMLRNAWNAGLWSVGPGYACNRCGELWWNESPAQMPAQCPGCGVRTTLPRNLLSIKAGLRRKKDQRLKLMGQWLPAGKDISFQPTKRHLVETPFEERGKVVTTHADVLQPGPDGLPPLGLSYEPHASFLDLLSARELYDNGFDDDAPEVDEGGYLAMEDSAA